MAKLYTMYHGDTPVAYAYGDEWVAMALYMDDIKFKTPEEAKAWWDKNYGDTCNNSEDTGDNSDDDSVIASIETNIFDEVEEHDNCMVQILRNSVTGEQSIGWWENA